CPGSALFLFKTKFADGKIKRYLHTGDFRACPRQVLHSAIAQPDNPQIDILYLDTTYLNERYCFPAQEQVVNAIIQLIKEVIKNGELLPLKRMKKTIKEQEDKSQMVLDQWFKGKPKEEELTHSDSDLNKEEEDSIEILDTNLSTASMNIDETEQKCVSLQDSKILIVVGTYLIGKEKVFWGIAKALNSKIYVSDAKRKMIMCQENPELEALLTGNPQEASVHVMYLTKIKPEELIYYLQNLQPTFKHVMAFRPTGWAYKPSTCGAFTTSSTTDVILNTAPSYTMDLISPSYNSPTCQIFGVPYSEHSSFRELAAFIMSLNIGRIIPTVNIESEESRKEMDYWLNKWQNEKKKKKNVRIAPYSIIDYCTSQAKGIKISKPQCSCNVCKAREIWVKSQKKTSITDRINKTAIGVTIGWIFFAFLAYKIATTSVIVEIWDPYEVLGIREGELLDTIKKRFKELSRQWHPDKAPFDKKIEYEEKFINISKAYQVLTNEETRKNYEEYGHPDGKQAYSLGIALPTWLVEARNSPIVLGIYGVVFGLLLPFYVGRWWYSSSSFTKNGIRTHTMDLYFRDLRANSNCRQILDLLSASIEFKELVEQRPTDNAKLPPIITSIKDELEKRFGEKYEKNKYYIVEKSIHLVTGLLEIALAHRWLQTGMRCMEVSQMLVQAMWIHENPLVQLPFVTPEILKFMKIKKKNVRSIVQLRRMNDEEIKNIIKLSNDSEYDILKQIADAYPIMQIDDAYFKVTGYDVITPGSLVTLVIKVKYLDSASEANKKPYWWIFMADDKRDKVMIEPIKITDIVTTKTFKFQFAAPRDPGLYTYMAYIKSDSYVGTDIKKELRLDVKDFSALPPDNEIDDDISEPEDDSFAGHLKLAREQGIYAVMAGNEKKNEDSDSSDDSDDD
ncbi:3927_t:CDS:10, partial [Cetraspora pellucida]